MNRFLSLFFTIPFLFVSVLLCAQNDANKKDPTGRADKLYQQKGYMASANKYQMKHGEDMTPEVMMKVANSYRLNGEFELAEYWYAKFINNNADTESILHYAEVLQSNGKCADAVRWYNEYKKKGASKRDFISDCNELDTFKKHDNMEVENLKALNTKYLDYSAIIHDEGVVFTSTRGVLKMSKVTDTWTKSNFSDVFVAKKNDEGNYETPSPISGAINKKYHDGVTTITKGGTIMYFSRNNSKGKNRDNEIDLKVYSSIWVNGAWTDAKELSFNSANFASCHPTISADGKWLYFASNRPNGFGGMDIYVSENKDGTWGEPINLGPTVNSEGNEIFPFINEEGALFFASNGHKGLGGLDIFYAEKSSIFDESTWNTRKNIGAPFNTKKDDFGFYGNTMMTEGFITSNRFGGKGGDDIYGWKSTDGKPLNLSEEVMTNFKVVDVMTNDVVRNATITVKDISNNMTVVEEETNSKGMMETTFTDGKKYKMMIEKDGYVTTEKVMTAAELRNGKTIKFDLEKIKCLELSGTVLNDKYNKAIPNATVTLVNKCTGEKTKVTSRADGSFDFCLDSGCDFEIVANKDDFMETETMVSTMNNRKNWGNKDVKIEMLPAKKVVKNTPVVSAPVAVPSTTRTVVTAPNVVRTPAVVIPPVNEKILGLRKYFLGNSNDSFHEGQVLTLRNIYYDYDKSNIRKDAQIELEQLVSLLKEYPNMEITLSSHTDARGDNEYNQKLSDARAISARSYMMNNGILSYRIKSIGLGETSLRNGCMDGVDCNNESHQENRRTEVLINKLY